jgi:hypothetical protein
MISSVEHKLLGMGEEEIMKGLGTTPVPNDLLDRVMPTLRDTELRVLLVVVRQTLGWQDGPDRSRRKERDWLTQSQLMRRTGRASEAVSAAVDGLVRARLIEVQDNWGRSLMTPAERRRFLGKLYYRLRPELGKNSFCLPESEDAKPNTTKETVTQKYRADQRIVDKSVEKSFLKKPFVVRTKGWEKAVNQEQSPMKQY